MFNCDLNKISELEVGKKYRFNIDGYSFIGIIIFDNLNEYPFSILDITDYKVKDSYKELKDILPDIENICFNFIKMLITHKNRVISSKINQKKDDNGNIVKLSILLYENNKVVDKFVVDNPTKTEVNNLKRLISILI